MKGSGRLSGKVALVTGSSRGMGAAFVKALAKEGAQVVINYASAKDRAQQVLDEIKSFGGTAIIIQGDVSKEVNVTHMIAEANQAFGKVDILVNNAAIPMIWNTFLDTTWADIVKESDISLKGTYLCCKAAIPGMIERKWGRIINIGGSALAHPFLKVYGYWMCKSSVLALSRTLALELGPYGITVNSIFPGQIETEFHEHWGPPEMGGKQTKESLMKVVNEKQAIKKLGQPEDITGAILYFASDDSSFTTGTTLHISGGMITTPV